MEKVNVSLVPKNKASDIVTNLENELRSLGLKVLAVGRHSVTVSCPKDAFQDIFGTRLVFVPANNTRTTQRPSYWEALRPLTVPKILESEVAEALLQSPPTLY